MIMQKNMDIRPHPSRNVTTNSTAKRSLFGTGKRRTTTIAAIVVAALLIGGSIWWYISNTSSYFIQTSKYQVVVLTNNQIYFGKLQRLYDDSYRLTNVYYLQEQAAAQGDTAAPADQAASSATPQLVKLGNELHGPEDAMIFDNTQVLYWENLKPDGKVSKSIEEYLKK